MNILHFSTLFPNREMPQNGIFVAERLKHLLNTGELTATILAPVPWFPFRSGKFGSYAKFAKVPPEGTFADSEVLHFRYPVIPKTGMAIAPLMLALSCIAFVSHRWGDLDAFDLIDAHYFYPDGVAAVLFGRYFGKPVVITGRGTDLNVIPDYKLPRRWIKWAASNAAGLVTVSESLRDQLTMLGMGPDRIVVLRNGVDLERFRPLDRKAIRERLNLHGKVALSVGNLVKVKGHDMAISSLVQQPEVTLIIAGEGHMHRDLELLARRLGVFDRVSFVGRLDQQTLVYYYNAADCVVLCSESEGMANVLLESLACGTPVVATAVGGNPEVICNPAAGLLIDERSATALSAALTRLWESYPDRSEVRKFAEQFDWHNTTQGQLRLFQESLESSVALKS